MKDIQEIVRKVADRYGVEYDSCSSGPKVKYKDGTIKAFDNPDLKKLFPKGSYDNKRLVKT